MKSLNLQESMMSHDQRGSAGPAKTADDPPAKSRDTVEKNRPVNRGGDLRLSRTGDMDQILSTREVEHITGRKRTTLYRWVLAHRFPPKHMSGHRTDGWLRSSIEQWLKGTWRPESSAPDAR